MVVVQGAFSHISNEVYHYGKWNKPCLSRGVIHTLLFKSPAHAFNEHPQLNPNYERKPDDEKFDIGSAAHPMLLQGNDIIEVINAKDWRTQDAKKARENARKNGKVPLLPHQCDSVRTMVRAAKVALVSSELGISDLSLDGDSEVSYFWQEDETWLKVRLDWISNDKTVILDYKTSESANPNDFVRKIVSYGYDIQHALYCRAVKAIHGTTPTFVFMVQEVTAPYLCSFVALSPEFQDMGMKKVNQGIAVWQHCLSTDNWPGYPTKVCWVDPPPWALTWQLHSTIIGSEEGEI